MKNTKGSLNCQSDYSLTAGSVGKRDPLKNKLMTVETKEKIKR
jgi:hypothetical protein